MLTRPWNSSNGPWRLATPTPVVSRKIRRWIRSVRDRISRTCCDRLASRRSEREPSGALRFRSRQCQFPHEHPHQDSFSDHSPSDRLMGLEIVGFDGVRYGKRFSRPLDSELCTFIKSASLRTAEALARHRLRRSASVFPIPPNLGTGPVKDRLFPNRGRGSSTVDTRRGQ